MRTFNSVHEFLAACNAETTTSDKRQCDRRALSWNGGLSWQQSHDLALHGDLSAVSEANQIMEQIDAKSVSKGYRPQWQLSVAGPVPCVPAYLANSPESMLQMSKRRAPRKQVNVYYSPVLSQNISADVFFKRGVAVLALVMQLGRTCDVNCFYYTTLGKMDHIIRLASPLVLSEAAHVFTSPGFVRNLSYMLAKSHDWTGDWARWFHYGADRDANIKAIRREVGATDSDIIIPPLTAHEENATMNDLVAYVNSLTAQHR